MIEKIRISLWDLLTFFLSGLLFTIIFSGHLYFIIDKNNYKLDINLSDIPTPFTLFVFPILLTLLGMLLEPIANLCDWKIINPIWKLIFKKSQEL